MKLRRGFDLVAGSACVLAALALVWRASRTDPAARAHGSFLERLLGPCAGLAASVQWVRADLALRESRFALAYERAETALRIAPADPQGWIFYAQQLLFQRASPLREPSAEARAAWAEAGFAILRRGEEQCSDPAELLLYEGEILRLWAGLSESERPWPGDVRAARERALAAFHRARELGHPLAAEFEQAARIELEASGR